MANTQISSNNVATHFDSEFFREWIRQNKFSAYMGTGSNNIIVTKQDRKKVSIPLVTRLKGNGASGSQTLRGNGENIGNYAFELQPTYYRHAVEFDKEEAEKPEFDIRSAARPLLMDWAMELTRDHIIAACAAVSDGSTYANFNDATESVKDAWSSNNSDRILYGAAKSNHSGDVSADLAKVDSSTDILSPDVVSLAARMAKTADPHIRPYRTKNDYETYVLFAGTRAYRDFYNSSVYQGNLQNARERAQSNPLFQPGDLMHDNVLIREVPEITNELTESAALSSAGNSSIPVEPCFLCGQQAIGFGLGQRPRSIVDNDFDYNFQPGVAVELKHEIKKMFWNNIQHGMVSLFVSGEADS